ncbi:MAG: hypothetical protein CMJ49_11310 [Planctomycetaceae bacterium]|nr:hypothetical protein [Planctomycetaceae bacterium]
MTRKARRILIGAATVAVVAIGLIIWFSQPAHPRPRNVIIISLDTTRADHLGGYGNTRTITPNIDQFAAQGVLFETVYAPAPMTLPSHATMMTGLDPPAHGVHDNLTYKLHEDHTTLADILGRRGFETGALISTFVLDSRFNLDQGFAAYDDHLGGDAEVHNNERVAGQTVDRALDWMRQNADLPFFMFLHFYDAHDPYEPPEPFRSRFKDNLYAGEIAYMDQQVGRVLDELTSLGLDDETIVIVVADHGEMLGSHGERTHSYLIYQPVIDVPMIIRTPGSLTDHRVTEPVGIVDVAPTICGVLGINALDDTNGEDLSPFLFDPDLQVDPRTFYCESVTPMTYSAGPLLGLIDGQWKYIHGPSPELYDLAADPAESNNVAAAHPQTVAKLNEQLRQFLKKYGQQYIVSLAPVDDDAIQRLESMDYAGGGKSVVSAMDLYAKATELHAASPLVWFHEQSLAANDLLEDGDFDAAESAFKQLIELRPEYVDGWARLATIAGARGDLIKAAEYTELALHNASPANKAKLLATLAGAYANKGSYKKAIENYLSAIDAADSFANQCGILIDLAAAYRLDGQTERAVDAVFEAYKKDRKRQALYETSTMYLLADGGPTVPNWRAASKYDISKFAPAAFARGMWYAGHDQMDLALQHLRLAEAKEDQDQVAMIQYRLGQVTKRLGDFAAATGHMVRAAELNDEWPEALNSAAWLLATNPDATKDDTAKAAHFASLACRIRPNDPGLLDTLAVTQAANGDFDGATQTAQRALEIATEQFRTDLMSEIRQRLNLYRQDKRVPRSPADGS